MNRESLRAWRQDVAHEVRAAPRRGAPTVKQRFVGPFAVAATALGGCVGPQSSLDPRGPAAAEIAVLWWIMAALGAVVFAIVVGLLALALWRPRRTPPP